MSKTYPSPFHVLVVGHPQSGEMRPVTDSLARIASPTEIIQVADIIAAVSAIGDNKAHIDLVVVCQQWSDEYSPSDAVRLIAATPLARFICCYGPWCESDARNREIWPPAIRVPASMFEHRLRRELDILRGKCSPLPLTASRDEAFLFTYSTDYDGKSNYTPFGGHSLEPRKILIQTPDRELERWLADLLTSTGHKPAAFSYVKADFSADVMLWDLDPWDARRLRERLTDAAGTDDPEAATIRIIGMMGMPLPEASEGARALGVYSVLPKFAPIETILAAVA